LSTLNLQDGRLSGKLDSSETLFAVVTVVEVAVVIVAVIEAANKLSSQFQLSCYIALFL